ncbi:MAG TPA: hypothetical protein VI306_07365 [Pyrinomonadaceae bacterium]
MNVVLEQLLAISGHLERPTGVAEEALTSLRVFLTASLIQQNPGALPIERDQNLDAAINSAAANGVILAAKLADANTNIRVLRDSYVNPTLTPDRPVNVLGPFIDADGTLVQFSVFENARFRTVLLTVPAPFPLVTDTLMFLPADSVSNDGNLTFTIPAGTVWLRAQLVVANTQGYVGLRVRQGTFKINRAAQPRPGNRIGVTIGSQWSLEVEPEQPAGPDGNGSDANELAVRLPKLFTVRSSGESQVNGRIRIRGFGSDLEFTETAGAPVADADSIAFPYDAGDAVWSINGNLSTVAQFTGESRVMSAAWTLPLNKLSPNAFGEAQDGGSLRLRLREELESRMLGTAGVFKWFDTIFTAAAAGLSLDALQATSSARTELDLWTPAHTNVLFAQESIGRLLFSSRRDGRDISLVNGGQVRNKWDLPLTASGKPFSYEGTIDYFAFIAEPGGQLRVAASATQPLDNLSHGVALENIYLLVRSPRKLAFTGDYDGVSLISDGTAVFFFDVKMAQPSLPDPYAANWRLADEIFTAEAALSITLRWANQQRPAIAANLERPVAFPQPRDIPSEEPGQLRAFFDRHLDTHLEVLNLLDLSSNDHHFGVALERLSDQNVKLQENRLAVEQRGVRLLMQPQVQWEPLEVVPNADAGVPNADTLIFKTNGARTLVGATSVKLVPVLPGAVSLNFVAAAGQRLPCAALFSLPFGLRAFARFDPFNEAVSPFLKPPIATTLHEPQFGDLTSARQLRLVATGALNSDPNKDPAARSMTGKLVQLNNLEDNKNKLAGVLSDGVDKNGLPIPAGAGLDVMLDALNQLPLHRADLSGYGLSSFSDWHQDVPTGITQVRFDVLNGRTSYEVIQAKTILAFPLCYVVRTVIFERRNSGKVLRFDSGWKAVNDGEFKVAFASQPANPEKNFGFEKGVVKAFRNIRRIRLLSDQSLVLPDLSVWQPVIFDADADLESTLAGSPGGLAPIYDHPGYIQLKPTQIGSEVTRTRIQQLLKHIGKPVGGGIDCRIRAGGTLEMQIAGIFVDEAPDDAGNNPALILAAYGLPKLPRAGQWSAVRINGSTSEATSVDPRHGIPIVRRTGQPTYIFREPGDVNRSRPDEFGFLMSTQTSRVLFPKPSINPAEVGTLRTDIPSVADPYSLIQSTSQFPKSAYALRCKEFPLFSVSKDDQWKLTNPNFTFVTPAPDLVKGGEWDMTRGFDANQGLQILLDSAIQNKPWEIQAPPNDLDLTIDGIPGTLFTIKSTYSALGGALATLEKPALEFGSALNDVKDIITSLSCFNVLTDLHLDVDVSARTVPNPSFMVTIRLKFRLGEGPNERIDIGIGKFYGEFTIRGELEAALSGKTRGLLSAEFQGDVQQGIIPPAIYAGGFFRFAIQIDESGKPTIELGLGTTASIGGDLIKNLLEVEVTVRYGYTLAPQSLEPGVFLGLEARAKLLGGLVGFSFSVEAMAKIKRISLEANEIVIWAQIRVCASVTVAWLVDEDIDVKTQFEQTLPLAAVAVIAFGPGGALL